jgi:phosphate acetyltransferase
LAQNLYITAMEPQSGKSVVALGLMELLSTRVERPGFFRPVVPSEPDPSIELVRRRYRLVVPPEEMRALTEAEAVSLDGYEEQRQRVVAAYKALEGRSDFVLCEGSDFGGATPALEFGRNADLANELGAPVLVVVRGSGPEETAAAVRTARDAIAHKGCSLFGIVVNRVAPELLEPVARSVADGEAGGPVYLLPELAELAYPSVGEVASHTGATVAFDGDGTLDREVRAVRIGAMSVEHFLDHLVPGTLVLVPGDRPDILVACLASAVSDTVPAVSGVVLTGGYPLGGRVRGLLSSAPFPVLELPLLTHEAAAAVQGVRAGLRPDDERKIATALGLFESSVDTGELQRRMAVERPARVTPIMFEYEILERAKQHRRRIVLPESGDARIIRAAEILRRRGVVELTLLGDPREVAAGAAALGVALDEVDIVDPLTSPLRDEYAARLYELRKHKGVTEELALDAVSDPTTFGTLMVDAEAADGMVSGAEHTTADTIRPALQLIRAQPGVSVVSSVFFMCLADRVLVYGDCAVNVRPEPAQLADIAISSAETAASFGIEPRVAMLSYSTGSSGSGEDVDAVRTATEAVRLRRPDLKVEGPIQYDAAVDATVAELKLPGSEVAGQATVFVFPDLATGNVAYKAVQRSAHAVAVGPVLQGLRRPVNDLSRGCTVADIVNTVAITAIQAHDSDRTAADVHRPG